MHGLNSERRRRSGKSALFGQVKEALKGELDGRVKVATVARIVGKERKTLISQRSKSGTLMDEWPEFQQEGNSSNSPHVIRGTVDVVARHIVEYLEAAEGARVALERLKEEFPTP